jgi:hypothetical protein
MPSTSITNKRKQVEKVLLRELQTADNVKRFSQTLRELEICDLRDDTEFLNISKDGAPYLLTLLTYSFAGILDKLLEIKKHTKEK